MNYTAPTIVKTATISAEVKNVDSNKAAPLIPDNPITHSQGSSSAYEADE